MGIEEDINRSRSQKSAYQVQEKEVREEYETKLRGLQEKINHESTKIRGLKAKIDENDAKRNCIRKRKTQCTDCGGWGVGVSKDCKHKRPETERCLNGVGCPAHLRCSTCVCKVCLG